MKGPVPPAVVVKTTSAPPTQRIAGIRSVAVVTGFTVSFPIPGLEEHPFEFVTITE